MFCANFWATLVNLTFKYDFVSVDLLFLLSFLDFLGDIYIIILYLFFFEIILIYKKLIIYLYYYI